MRMPCARPIKSHPQLQTHQLTPLSNRSSHPPQIPPLQTRHHRPARNPSLPTLHRPLTPQTSLFQTRKPPPPLLPPLSSPSHPSLSPPPTYTPYPPTNQTPTGPRNRPLPPPGRRPTRPALAIASHTGAPGSRGGVHGASVRRHESVRHPCEAGDDYAEGCAVGEED